MVNLQQRISLTRKSKGIIKAFVQEKNGRLNVDSWDQIPKFVKNEISKRLIAIQGLSCVYCEGSLVTQGNQIDHFSPKSKTPEFSFTTTNLFYSCIHCNSKKRKGDRMIINTPVLSNYHENNFKITHPYYDNTDSEIVFIDQDRILFDWERSSPKGIYTIWFFKWCDAQMTMIRSMNAILRAHGNNLKDSDRELINSIISYR